MAHKTLKATIRQYIGPNGQNSITGQIMQDILIAMVDEYPNLSGYATQSWVLQQGYVTSSALADYATVSQLAEYLPLTGGTLTGALNIDKGASSIILDFGGVELIQSGADFKISASHNFITNKDSLIITNLVENTIGTIEIHNNKLSVDNSITATSFIMSGGTSAQFLKADGSVDSNTYITASALTGYATQSWVTTQLGDYLPLTGGTLTGALNIDKGASSIILDFGGVELIQSGADFKISASHNFITNKDSLIITNLVENTIGTIEIHNNKLSVDNSITATSFIMSGGTSAQFLKADGSVDSNTYITASALTGYATQSWVQQQGYLTSSALSGYATQAWVTTQLGDYMPLAGGTITGNLTVNGAVKFNSSLTFAYDRGIYFGSDDDVRIMRDTSRLQIVNELGADIIIGDYDNRNYTSIVNDLQGGTTDSTYSSVTQKWLILQDGTAQFKSVSQTSDLRKKTIIDDVLMDLDNVANAPLFKFTWNDETKYSGQHIGTAAQYWQNILPELVSIGRDADMTLAIQYDVIALASAITVAKTVVDHEARIRQLEEKIK